MEHEDLIRGVAQYVHQGMQMSNTGGVCLSDPELITLLVLNNEVGIRIVEAVKMVSETNNVLVKTKLYPLQLVIEWEPRSTLGANPIGWDGWSE